MLKRKTQNAKRKTGLVIGRFQPFHKGHSYLIKKALSFCDEIIIGIGSSNQKNAENPWNANQRKAMIKLFLQKEGLQNRAKKIIAIPDVYDDKKWLNSICSQVEGFDIVIGNNAWVNRILESGGYKVQKIPYYKRYLYEGERIRALMREGKPWEERVPGYIAKKITAAKKKII